LISKYIKELKLFENKNVEILSDVNGTRIEGTEEGKQILLQNFFNDYINKCFPYLSMDHFVELLSKYYPRLIINNTLNALNNTKSWFKHYNENYYFKSLFIAIANLLVRKQRGKSLSVNYKKLFKNHPEL